MQTSQLEADSDVISEAYDELTISRRQTGFEAADEEALEAFAEVWARRRWTDQDAELSTALLLRAAGYGRLKVQSEPSGATITVDGKKWANETDAKEWTSEGEKKIILKKENCKVVKGEIRVRAGEEVIFDKTLDCN